MFPRNRQNYSFEICDNLKVENNIICNPLLIALTLKYLRKLKLEK